MKKLFTAQDIEALIKQGGDLGSIPDNAVVTPSARDLIREHQKGGQSSASSGNKPYPPVPPVPILPDYEYRWANGGDPATPEALQDFFYSQEITTLKERMVDIGRRMWEKDYTDGNGGNITIRVGDNIVLCTPTLISKGFMTVDDMCFVNLNGEQIAGVRKSTSEVKTHLALIRRTPKAKACVHAHPPHATAFAVAGVQPPTCMIPEAEVFLGQIGMAPYDTPGTMETADAVGALAEKYYSIIMENHGVITMGKDVEEAYWRMENTEAYCKTVWVASQLGNGLQRFGTDKLRDLIALRQKMGMDDFRADFKECELCDAADEFRPGVVCQNPADASSPAQGAAANSDAEAVVKQITDQIMAKMK